MSDDNIWTDEWDEGEDWSGGGSKSKRLPRTERLGATVPDRSAGAHGFRNDGPASGSGSSTTSRRTN